MPTSAETEEGIHLVLGVARLGEQGLRGWWRSYGLGKAGMYVLKKTYPRTYLPTALELDVLSAAHRHDDLLGRPTAIHLFSSRLPFRRWAEAWLAEQKLVAPDPLLDVLAGWNLGTALETLQSWSGSNPGGERVGEGLLLGQISRDELLDLSSLLSYGRLLTAAYLDQETKLLPPYFDLKH